MSSGHDLGPSHRKRRVLDRVVALRRAAITDGRSRAAPEAEPDGVDLGDVVQDLRRRVDHLEQELQGLQDSVHRESQRRDDELAALRRHVQPAEMARSLSDDARRRGI